MNNEIKIQPSKGNNKVEINNNFAQYFEQLAKKHADDAKESELLAKDWANKLGSTVDDTEYSSKYYALKSKEEHDGAVTDIATAKTELEQSIATGLEDYNTNAQAKSESLQTQFDTSISNIKKQETTSINAVKTTQTTAETSITELKTSAELTITNGIADIKTNKEQSMSAIDENRISSIEEISNTKTTAISDVSTAGAEQVSNIKKTGFYMQDDKLYYINADGETKEFISGGGRELLEIYIDPFCDESENKGRIANGQIIIQSQFKDVTKKLKKRVGWDSVNKKATLNTSLVCTEEEWQAIKTASKLGQCGKFVIDDEAGTIRLPAIININGLTDLSKAGLIKDESLPSHSHTRGSMNITGQISLPKRSVKDMLYYQSGALYNAGATVGGDAQIANAADDWVVKLGFDASRSWTGKTSNPDNSTYQNDAPVQQEAVQYPYVICVNTGVEEAERPINNYQVNNTNSYGDNKYVGDMTLNNASWLKSTGQSNSGTVYTGFYNWAVANIGQPFGAGLIKESSATDITDYDLVIDQANQTFILPTLNGSEDLPSDKFDNLTLGASDSIYVAPANGWYVLDKSASAVGQYSRLAANTGLKVETGSTFTTQASCAPVWVKRGDKTKITYNLAGTLHSFIFVYAKGNGNLYYYVGDTLQNADLINIARMQEELVNKVDKKQATQASMPSGKYIDLTLGASGTTYTAPADGLFVINKRSTGAQQYVNIGKVDSIPTVGSFTAYASGVECWSFQSVLKGEEVKVYYTCGGKLEWFRFIYAVGSQP